MKLTDYAAQLLQEIDAMGTRKNERPLLSPQASQIVTHSGGQAKQAINLCANNYLGLAADQRLVEAAKVALERYGVGMASVRFICGTQDLHQTLEQRTAAYLGMEDCIVFSSCFDANGGVFEPLLTADDAIISDSLNHASIIDGVRLCKAQRWRYHNNDMADLESQLKAAQSCRQRLIVTDGVFSMDGTIANLPAICELAEQYQAAVMVDDCHATGLLGSRGAGTPEMLSVEGRIDILTGTYGKALGGASGGYVAGSKAVVELLRQRARPYLFSNAVPPAICAAALAAIDIAEQADTARQQLQANAQRFRHGMTSAGFTLLGASHPIIPVLVGDAALAGEVADALLQRGIYVTAFSYPVVPKGMARIRTQMSAAHTEEQIDQAIAAFIEVGRIYQLIA
ncbi:MAG: glycine C-acetyltransferase [Gammaproteobacteria bacterium]|nr:glycine C-acetyltransferase [Gammaproteobacteria bacterium]